MIKTIDEAKAFIKENNTLISSLIKNNSKAISRFVPVIKVVEYVYNQHHFKKLTDEEMTFFSTGFDYIFDQFHFINTILESKFKGNINEMEKFGTTINLLLYINEFQGEALNSNEPEVKKGIKLLDELSEKVNNCLDNNQNANEEYFQILNDILSNVFEANDIELHTIDEIFYEIALEYNLETEVNDDKFIDSFNKEINKHR